MDYHVHLTPKSSNAKTGPIPVSTTTADTCPPTCGAFDGCYAKSGPLAIHWGKVTRGERGMDWANFCDQIATLPEGQLWRHNQAGDLPGDGRRIDPDAMHSLIGANLGRRGFTYTHYPVDQAANAALVYTANTLGFTVNLSADSLEDADRLADLNIGPVVTLLPSTVQGQGSRYTPAGRRVVVCPATYLEGVSCASCGLCARQRDVIVGFPAHGSKKRAINFAIARKA